MKYRIFLRKKNTVKKVIENTLSFYFANFISTTKVCEWLSLCNHEITIVDLEHSQHDSRHIMWDLNGLRCWAERSARDVNDQFYVRSSIRIVGTMSSKRLKPERNSGSRDGRKLCDRKWQRRARFTLAFMKRPIQ